MIADTVSPAVGGSGTNRYLVYRNRLQDALSMLAGRAAQAELVSVRGRVLEIGGCVVRACAPGARIGELCWLEDGDANPPGREGAQNARMAAEVVAVRDDEAVLCAFGDVDGLSGRAVVRRRRVTHSVAVSDALQGRVLDGFGTPIDAVEGGAAALTAGACDLCVHAAPPPALTRSPIHDPLSLGVRAIDAFLTAGVGQRLGIFAAAGAGKSTLLGMLVRQADVDVVVVALVGERGREVREFIEHGIGADGMRRCVVVAATADRPALERARAAQVATTIAEYHRDRGRRVLLVMDSVTRYARALREVGLAAGEVPTRRGFPSSVFASLARLLERAGTAQRGAITAHYTVLVEGDDMTEPVADEVRSILDGHVILSRELGAANHYPAIDIARSVSRVMPMVASASQQAAAGRVRMLLAKLEEVELLVRVGEYRAGSDPLADEALAKRPRIDALLRQGVSERSSFAETQAALAALAGAA